MSATGFPAAARATLADSQLRRNLGHATQTIRAKRAAVVGDLPDWEALREAGRQVKQSAMLDLAEHLERLERSVQDAGGVVHWARDAAEANAIVGDIAAAAGADEVIKVKLAGDAGMTARDVILTHVRDGGADQGRRALTLVPDLNVCVVETQRIVGSVPEAVSALRRGATGHRRPLTFVSGPSATSDIELDRVEGVHGSRRLEVLIVG